MPKPTPRILTFKGESLPLTEWARRTGLHRETIRSRIDHQGWTVERALGKGVEDRQQLLANLELPVVARLGRWFLFSHAEMIFSNCANFNAFSGLVTSSLAKYRPFCGNETP